MVFEESIMIHVLQLHVNEKQDEEMVSINGVSWAVIIPPSENECLVLPAINDEQILAVPKNSEFIFASFTVTLRFCQNWEWWGRVCLKQTKKELCGKSLVGWSIDLPKQQPYWKAEDASFHIKSSFNWCIFNWPCAECKPFDRTLLMCRATSLTILPGIPILPLPPYWSMQIQRSHESNIN